jgi:DNA-binding NarL/FixJ family response regulator
MSFSSTRLVRLYGDRRRLLSSPDTYAIQDDVLGGIRAGAVGYLLQDAQTSVLLDGIRAAQSGAFV